MRDEDKTFNFTAWAFKHTPIISLALVIGLALALLAGCFTP